MFESAEVGNRYPKARFNREEPKLRAELLAVQKRLAEADLTVVLVVSGVEGAGKGETVHLLHEWMDARGLETHAMWDTTDEEEQRPFMWRFWRVLPPKGRIGIFFGSWYTKPIIDRVFDRSTAAEFDRSLDRIVEFERMLAQENVLLIKLWLHLSKDRQRKRLKELRRDKEQSWRVTKMDWKFFKMYDDFRMVSEHALRRTSLGEAPWHVVEGADPRWRSVSVVRLLLDSLESKLDALEKAGKPRRSQDMPVPRQGNLLRALDMTKKLPEAEYDEKMAACTGEISEMSRRLRQEGRSLLLLFEGPDAAGKGGAIRRIISAMDARNYQVISVAAPTDEERAHPYLWRFWRHLPRKGRVTIYDRSWYGRVLVERLEGFCAKEDWQRAFAEINGFEDQLTEFGIIVRKFWIAITPQEQLRRFKNREMTPYKQYKITQEDWRNRQKWGAYEAAACDMIERTSTENVPWVLVEGNDKNHARVKVMKAVRDALRKGI